MEKRLTHVRIAVLATDGFEESELNDPVRAYRDEGAEVSIISPKPGSIRAWRHKDWGPDVQVDVPLDKAIPADYDALHLPGGVVNPDSLRMNPKAVEFVREFLRENKPVGAICHGPWTLIEAGAVKGKMVTSWPSLKTDLKNAGAIWVDREVVEDHGIITSRNPGDIPAYIEKTVEQFSLAAQVSTF